MACFMKKQKKRLGKITLRRVIKKHDRLQATSRRIVICHGSLQRYKLDGKIREYVPAQKSFCRIEQ
jgi:hypothetical protein